MCVAPQRTKQCWIWVRTRWLHSCLLLSSVNPNKPVHALALGMGTWLSHISQAITLQDGHGSQADWEPSPAARAAGQICSSAAVQYWRGTDYRGVHGDERMAFHGEGEPNGSAGGSISRLGESTKGTWPIPPTLPHPCVRNLPCNPWRAQHTLQTGIVAGSPWGYYAMRLNPVTSRYVRVPPVWSAPGMLKRVVHPMLIAPTHLA